MSASAPGDGAVIARNAATSYASRLVLGVSALLLTPYLFRTLGPGGFGTWSVIFTLATVFDLLEIGFATGVTKIVAELRARGRHAELGATIGAAVALMGVLGLVPAAGALAVAFLASGIAASGEEDAFTLGLIVVALAGLVRFPCYAYAATLMGHQRYDVVNLTSIIGAIALPVGAVVAVEAGAGVLGVAAAYAAAMVLEGILYAAFLKRIHPRVSLAPRLPSRPTRRRLTSFGSFVMLADSMNFVGARMDVLVIGAIRSAAHAAPFAAAVKLQTALQSLTLPFVRLLMPMASDLWARDEREELMRRVTLATRVAAQITIPAAVALALFSRDVVHLWLGAEAPAVTAAIVVVLVTVQAITLPTAPAEKVLVGVGRVRLIGTLAIVEGVSNVALSILLVYEYGAIGAAIGTFATTAVLAPVRFPLVCRTVGYPLPTFLRLSLGAAIASSLPALVAMGLVWTLLPSSALRLAAGIAVGLGLAAGVALVQIGPRRLARLIRAAREGPAPHWKEGGGELVSEVTGGAS